MLARVGRDLAAAVVPAREVVLKAVVCEPVFRILLCRAGRRKGVVLFGVARIGVAILAAVARCVDEPDRSAEVVELVGLAAAFVVREACAIHAVIVYVR